MPVAPFWMAHRNTSRGCTGADSRLPVETTPLSNEPFAGTRNPRDRFTTIIASLPGEEQFFDMTSGGGEEGFSFATLLASLFDHVDEGKLNLNFEDEVVAGACLTHGGEIKNERAKEAAA